MNGLSPYCCFLSRGVDVRVNGLKVDEVLGSVVTLY